MSQLLKSSGAMAIATLSSRILGMVREIVYARFMGDSWVAGAFMLAFTIPNLFRRLLGEGALTAAFIPVFKEKEKLEGERQMWRAANAVISGLLISGIVLVVIVIIGVSIAIYIGRYQQETALMLKLLRLMFPYMLLVCLAAILIGMANARGHFFIPAMGATMLNIVMILSVFLIAPRLGATLETQIYGLAIGVLIAGVVQASFQLPTLYKEGFRPEWVSPFKDPTVHIVLKRMIPGTLGVAAYQINMLVTQSIAFGVSPTIVASYNYAVRLMELPQGVFGISIATYLLPTLSGYFAEKKYDNFRSALRNGIEHLIVVNMLATVLLTLLAEPIIRLLFERGQFSALSTQRVAFALMFLAPGLVAFSTINILARAYFATGDTRTPMKTSVFCFAVNIIFTILLVKPLQQGGMALANTATAFINVFLLYYGLQKKLKTTGLEGLRKYVLLVMLIATLSGTVAYYIAKIWHNYIGHQTLYQRLGEVFVPIGAATLVYYLAGWALKIAAINEFFELIKSKIRKK
ncbi:MAG: murein biosynthesis integral membrane protein MurJ [Limisphaerales bacterium]